MRNMNFFIGLFLVCSLFSCKLNDNDIVDPVYPCNPMPCPDDGKMGELDTLWTYRLHEDNISGFNFGITTLGDYVIHNTTYNSGHGNGHVISLNQNTGLLEWEWQEIIADYYPSFSYSVPHDIVIVQNRDLMASIDVVGGHTFNNYAHVGDRVRPFGQLLGDYYYHTRLSQDESVSTLVRSHITDFSNWETVYSIHTDDVGGSRPNIQSYNLWIDPQSGDEILVFQHRMAFPNRVDVVGYNMTQGEVIWQHDDLTALGNSNHEQIFILDDKAYFSGGTAFYCFDIPTGEIVWQYDHPSGINSFGFYKTVYAENENLIIVKDAGDRLYAFHPISGNVVWVKTNVGFSATGAGSPSYHNGILYYTAGYESAMHLIAVRAVNGQLLYAERSRLNYHSHFNGDVAIDPERGVLYASDRYYLMAIKLYED